MTTALAPLPIDRWSYLPRFLSLLLPELVTRGDPKAIYLTFDDGPDPYYTPRILDRLEEAGVRATFFLLAKAVRQYPHYARQIVEKGHWVGIHGDDHRPLPFWSVKGVRERLTVASEVIANLTGADLRLVRPPYGWITPALYRWALENNKTLVLWSVAFGEWKGEPPDPTLRKALSRIRSGDIILLHDGGRGAPGTLRVLQHLLPLLIERNCSARPLTLCRG